MTGVLIFITGFGGASLLSLFAWTFMSCVRDLHEEDAVLAAAADDQQMEGGPCAS